MKLQITFPNGFHVFCRIQKKDEIKIVATLEGSYLVEQTLSPDSEFYIFTHPTFYFKVRKDLWDSGDFLKKLKITASKV